MSVDLVNANALHIPLADESVHAVVTSPPYYALRDYKTNGQLGLEKRADCLGWATGQPCGECYICQMVAVFREVKRVLRKDGTLFLNCGDSYAGGGRGSGGQGAASRKQTTNIGSYYLDAMPDQNNMKPKDMMLIPQRLALALQAPYLLPRLMKNDIDRSWLAAFTDGEGTISIRHQSEKGSNGEPCNDGYVPFLSAGNNDTELLDHCVEITGYGSVKLKDHPHIDDRGIISRRDYMGWRIESNKAIEVISEIYPFLIAKKKQAILAYTLDLSNKGGRALRGNKALPKEEQEKRAYLKKLINKCNQREPIDLPDWCIEPETKQRYEPGWYVRSDIIWAKPNPMPESVTDRPTKSHEYIWLLAKSAKYFWDAEAVREGEQIWTRKAGGYTNEGQRRPDGRMPYRGGFAGKDTTTIGRNLRDVWTIATQPYSGAHYATYPEELVLRCLKAATSERGCCPKCGKMWEREVEKQQDTTRPKSRPVGDARGKSPSDFRAGTPQQGSQIVHTTTLGFRPGCACDLPPVPATILDPFCGSGTTLLVAKRMGLKAIGLDLSYQYLRENAWERVGMNAPILEGI